MHRSNIVAPLVVMFGTLLGADAAQTEQSSNACAPSPIMEVRTVHPKREATGKPVRLPAVAEPFEQAFLYARVNGFVADRRADVGDRVESGQVLAVIEAPELVRNSERAKAALAQSEAQVVLAKSNLLRAERLGNQNFVSREVLETRQAEALVAKANREAAAAEVSRLTELLGFREVRAPFAGVVVARNIERGDLVAGDQPHPSAHLFHLAQIDKFRVVVHVPQSAVKLVEQGKPVRIIFPEFPQETFSGQITRIANFIDARSGAMRVEILLPNPGGRIPASMYGQVEFTPPSASTLRLPTNSVTLRRGVPHVALFDDGRVKFTPVRLGRDFGAESEVLEGVTENQMVVINPNALLRDGDLVVTAEKNSGH